MNQQTRTRIIQEESNRFLDSQFAGLDLSGSPDLANPIAWMILEGWGQRVELGQHAFDKYGHFLAGRDEDRLADLNDALQIMSVQRNFHFFGRDAGGTIPLTR